MAIGAIVVRFVGHRDGRSALHFPWPGHRTSLATCYPTSLELHKGAQEDLVEDGSSAQRNSVSIRMAVCSSFTAITLPSRSTTPLEGSLLEEKKAREYSAAEQVHVEFLPLLAVAQERGWSMEKSDQHFALPHHGFLATDAFFP